MDEGRAGGEDLKSKVEDEGYTVDDIVAVRSGTNGELTLVVDDRK